MIFFFAFLATIPAANWLIGNVGTHCVPDGPCLVPVGFGLEAPSGVLMVGLALVLRDIVHRNMGGRWALATVSIGTVISYFVADPYIAIASVTAFAVAELVNQAIYHPIYRKNLIAAVLISSAVGAVLDSVLFVWIAFGSLDYSLGQIVGKMWMIAAAAFVVWAMERRAALAKIAQDA